MYIKLFFATICFSFSLLQAHTLYVSPKETKDLIHKEIKLEIDPYAPEPMLSNEAKDTYGHPYKRVVLTKTFSKSKERTNLGGGALAYYLNSFFSIKTGPSYIKGEGIEKIWKWSLQLTCEYPFFPIK